MKNTKDPSKITRPFYPVYNQLASCCEIKRIDSNTHKEITLKWDIYIEKVYSFLLSRFNYHSRSYMSYDYLSAQLNISGTTIMTKIHLLRDFGVISYESKKGYAGLQQSNNYTRVDNIIEDNKYRLVKNLYHKEYNKKYKDRQKRLELLQGEIVDRSWSKGEAINYWKNRNYELLHGIYLDGNKTENLLYLDLVTGCKGKESYRYQDLKKYEVDKLLEDLNDK